MGKRLALAVIATVLVSSALLPAPAGAGSRAESLITAYVTGYSYWDNTPAGTAEISHPVIHDQAGGVGTYTDPVTVAVGHSIIGGRDILDWPQGTRFYIPNLQRYFIVEDTCGDGRTPQDGPCHTGYPSGSSTWLDVYVDGSEASRSQSDTCMSRLTGKALVIVNPGDDYRVTAGPISDGTCAVHGDTVVMATSGASTPTPSQSPTASTSPAPRPTISPHVRRGDSGVWSIRRKPGRSSWR